MTGNLQSTTAVGVWKNLMKLFIKSSLKSFRWLSAKLREENIIEFEPWKALNFLCRVFKSDFQCLWNFNNDWNKKLWKLSLSDIWFGNICSSFLRKRWVMSFHFLSFWRRFRDFWHFLCIFPDFLEIYSAFSALFSSENPKSNFPPFF